MKYDSHSCTYIMYDSDYYWFFLRVPISQTNMVHAAAAARIACLLGDQKRQQQQKYVRENENL